MTSARGKSTGDEAQLDFTFQDAPAQPGLPGLEGDALAAWREERRQANEALCRKLGLPINHRAEVNLAQGMTLRGYLRLAQEVIWIQGSRQTLILAVDAVTFRLVDVESAVRLDG